MGTIVTIDGPAGTGKSTAARGLAARLGFEYLDTGAMYRAVALALMRANIAFSDAAAVVALLNKTTITMNGSNVTLNGVDVSEEIRGAHMSDASSRVAVEPHVRAMLVQLQRQIAQGRNMVCEGRDQGTVVFTDSRCKIYLTAAVEVRADRRFAELRRKGVDTTIEKVLEDLKIRDYRDSHRQVGPLRCPPDAAIIETDSMTEEQVLDKLVEVVRRCHRG